MNTVKNKQKEYLIIPIRKNAIMFTPGGGACISQAGVKSMYELQEDVPWGLYSKFAVSGKITDKKKNAVGGTIEQFDKLLIEAGVTDRYVILKKEN